MVDRPIIFSGAMVRALLDGRKTMTRRLAWRSPPYQRRFDDPSAGMTPGTPSPWRRVKPGDRLWVREAHATSANPDLKPWYRLNYPEDRAAGPRVDVRWRSSIHMPRWASRLTLTVTAVRVERLQEISEADAGAEGMADFAKLQSATSEDMSEAQTRLKWRQREFAMLWDQLHGAGAWDANPEVVAITFTVAQRNIDNMEIVSEEARDAG